LNTYSSPAALGEHVTPPQLPIRGSVHLDELMWRKAIGRWIYKKGHVRRQRIRLVIVAIIIAAAFIPLLIILDPRAPRLIFTAPLVVAVLLCGSAVRAPRLLTKAIMKALNLRKNGSLMGRHFIEITETTIRRGNEHYDLTWRIASLSEVHRFPEMVLIEATPGSFFPIPSTADLGVNSFDVLADFLEHQRSRAAQMPT
jgi:hypothetical protein